MAIRYEDFETAMPKAKSFGHYYLGLCPFHDGHNPNGSMMVFEDGWFRCLGCNRNGRWQQLWNKLNGQNVVIRPEVGTTFKGPDTRAFDSLDDMAYQANRDLMKFDSFQWYLKLRGLEDRIDPCNLGYYKGWYTIPVYDRDGEFQTMVFRAASHVQEATGQRYWCPQKEAVMYVPDWYLLDSSDYIVVVYGILDALTLSSLRIPVVTTSFGKDSFKAEWLDQHRDFIHVLPDKGEELSAWRLKAKLGWRGKPIIRLNFPNGAKDANDYFQKGLREQLEIELRSIL